MIKYIQFLSVSVLAITCPPKQVTYLDSFDLESYISKPWFIQYQQPILYTPKKWLFCNVDRITKRSDGTLDLETTWNDGSVTGKLKVHSVNGIVQDIASNLKVGPRFIPEFLRGPMWIIAFEGTTIGKKIDYEWVIASGGAPKHESNGKCRPGTLLNNSGLWLMTREPHVSQQLIDRMTEVASSLGFDTKILVKVEQEGCDHSRKFVEQKL